MGRALVLVYGVIAYVAFLATFLYLIGWLTGLGVPRSIDTAPVAAWPVALAIDLALILLFGLQHSIMARPAFKRWWTRLVPRAAERSTFVLATCGVLGLTFWLWRSPPGTLWSVEHPVGVVALWTIAAAGWLVVLLSTVLIDHLELFGLRQVLQHVRGKESTPPAFKVAGFYRHVRHPLMLGFLVAFWATPVMTASRLIFALACTTYVLVAIRLEERDLQTHLGDDYARYRQQVPMLLPLGRPARPTAPPSTGPVLPPRRGTEPIQV